MNPAEVLEHCRRFSYNKEDRKLMLDIDCEFDDPQLRMRLQMNVFDARKKIEGKNLLEFVSRHPIKMIRDVGELKYVVQKFVRDSELHETDEWLCFNSQMLWDPHMEEGRRGH